MLFCRFPLRIHKPIQGIFDPEIKKDNKELRRCQREIRRSKRLKRREQLKKLIDLSDLINGMIRKDVLQGRTKPNAREKELLQLQEEINNADDLIQSGLVNTSFILECDKIEQLFKEYQVSNIDDLLLSINRPLLDEFNVTTMEELLDTLPKVNLENIEVAYRNKKISFEDYKFYIFNTSKLGWKNIDIFAKIPPNQMTQIKINLPPAQDTDCKLVFPERAFVLPGKLADDYFYFEGVPKKEKAWVVGLKYENGQPMLAMKYIEIKQETFDLEFETLTLSELKEKLKILDFEN